MDYDTPVVILCGGQGTRIREVSERLPKGMVEIGGRPVLWHIMKLYSHYGYHRFILCLGYKGWEIKQFFLDYRAHLSDFTISLSQGDHQPQFHNGRADENWEITFAETGLDAGTGARLRRIRQYIDTPSFMMTYGDGVSAVDIDRLVKTHVASGRIGTVTGVHPTSKFGEMQVDGDRVAEFNEKPTQVTGFVSGGYFMFERSFLDDYLNDDEGLFLEHEPLQRLARDGQLTVNPHEGFWAAMDTYKDYQQLNALWATGQAPWRLWEEEQRSW
ncbi:glucose-1-phosphate cytidylyltransferase [Pseudonocardia acidicola]|uniref:Glucose-1-phosphate cytidylyltransferase n=1 Tax=Pseudonocardia acidicola TaxID=2724939 RepID=A0ABX1SBK5_9PSEU|nr:glucose-1-phosphate cytidylyltransferase [Pseudonocardia acidicola]NMH98945.1 glucose-1-phosphate cytidylyltransferase [Pseudonocardia acidicola]